MIDTDPGQEKLPSSTASIWKISIATSLAASVIFAIIFQPIINNGGRLFISLISTFADDFVNRSYAQAPVAVTNSILFKFDSLITAVVLGLATFIIIYFSGFLDGIIKRHIQKRERSDIKKRRQGLPIFLRILGVAYGCSFAFGFLSSTISSYISIQANASFERTMMAIRPFLDENEEQIIESKWSLVRSKRDYETLLNEMDEIAKKSGSKTVTRFI